MESDKPQWRVRLFDVVWIAVAAGSAVALGAGLIDLLDSVIGPDAEGAGPLLTQVLVVALWLVTAWWIGMGAWRRTSRGCRLDVETGDRCPRHGRHCAAAERAQLVT